MRRLVYLRTFGWRSGTCRRGQLSVPDEPNELSPSTTVQTTVATVETLETWHGPLPPPSILGEYEAALPGSADRILAMAESEQKNRHENAERTAITIQRSLEQKNKNVSRGALYGLIIVLAAIGGGVFLAYSGKPIYGSILALVPITGLVVGTVKRFLTGSRQNGDGECPG